MLLKDAIYNEKDLAAVEILKDFLPDRIFDAHAHLFDSAFLPNVHPASCGVAVGDFEAYQKAMSPMLGNPKELRVNVIPFPDKSMAASVLDSLALSDAFLIQQLEKYPENVGALMVRPNESAEDIEKRLVHPAIRGLKCYHTLAPFEKTWDLPISAYLPEGAWVAAARNKMYITLHMVKDQALADPENMEYICKMAKKYPDAVLILAHAARSFAAWTAIESIEKIVHLENVWFDFSSICESPAMFKIIQKAGIDRCMWGSDYPVSNFRGKAISIADTFHWIYQADCEGQKNAPQTFWLVGIENLMAVRQACLLAELSQPDIEKLFYHNAMRLFNPILTQG